MPRVSFRSNKTVTQTNIIKKVFHIYYFFLLARIVVPFSPQIPNLEAFTLLHIALLYKTAPVLVSPLSFNINSRALHLGITSDHFYYSTFTLLLVIVRAPAFNRGIMEYLLLK